MQEPRPQQQPRLQPAGPATAVAAHARSNGGSISSGRCRRLCSSNGSGSMRGPPFKPKDRVFSRGVPDPRTVLGLHASSCRAAMVLFSHTWESQAVAALGTFPIAVSLVVRAVWCELYLAVVVHLFQIINPHMTADYSTPTPRRSPPAGLCCKAVGNYQRSVNQRKSRQTTNSEIPTMNPELFRVVG